MTTALVVGAGIGGLSAAAALANAGLTVEVFERTPNPRELGFALLLAPNAMAALRELGIADTVLARGALLRRGQIRRGDGRVLKAIEFSKIRASLGEETVCVLRPVLHGALLERVGREGLHLGALVTGYRTGKAGVELAAAGEPTVHGDLLVGADGVGSAIRRALHPLEPPPRRRGILAFRG
ncbi:MAG TPA: FAD-dependent monooxygenase, partial [Polyangiaceae bacterium]|nr:FAD-dependent monooxygenase [Polyangiaceae bacterium]